MNKFLKSVFLMLAIVGVQPNHVYAVDWEDFVESCMGLYTYGAMIGGGALFAHSQIKNSDVDLNERGMIVSCGLLSACVVGSFLANRECSRNKRKNLKTSIAEFKDRLDTVEKSKHEEAARKKELAVLRGKGRVPNFFGDQFGGPVDLVAKMSLPNKQQLCTRLDEQVFCRSMVTATNQMVVDCDERIREEQKRDIKAALFLAPITVPYLIGGGVMAGRALAPYFAKKR